MKYLEAILEEMMPNLSLKRPGPVIRQRAGVDLDEDLFMPAGRKVGPAGSAEMDRRQWPTLDVPAAKPLPNLLESRIVELERELAMRCTQVADLYNLQERQTSELRVAYAEVERLNATFAELEVTAAQHMAKAAERKQAISALYQENAVLRGRLENAQDESAALSNKMLTVETLFNDREMVITTALEQADLLKAEVAAMAEEKERLTAALSAVEQLNDGDRARNLAVISELNRKLESLFTDHGVQLKTREKLARRVDELTRMTGALERAGIDARDQLLSQGEHTTFLETVMRVERENAEARIAELNGRLEEERRQRAESERASSAMRKEMAILLRAIARQRAEAAQPRQDAA